MSTTVIYKGWMDFSRPKRNRDETAIIAPNRFFYRPKNYIITDMIRQDAEKYGKFVNIRMWAHYSKIKADKLYIVYGFMGPLKVEYSEISRPDHYSHTNQYIYVNSTDFLQKLIRYFHHYCIIEITYSQSEYDMVSHEIELILLRDSII